MSAWKALNRSRLWRHRSTFHKKNIKTFKLYCQEESKKLATKLVYTKIGGEWKRPIFSYVPYCAGCMGEITGPNVKRLKYKPTDKMVRGVRPLYGIRTTGLIKGPNIRVTMSSVKDCEIDIHYGSKDKKQQNFCFNVAKILVGLVDRPPYLSHLLYRDSCVYEWKITHYTKRQLIFTSYSPRESEVRRYARNPYIDLFRDLHWVPRHRDLFPTLYAMNPYI